MYDYMYSDWLHYVSSFQLASASWPCWGGSRPLPFSLPCGRLKRRRNYRMLTKNCRTILDSILTLPVDRRYGSHRIVALAEKTGLPFCEALAACKELDQDNLATLNISHLRNGQEIPESILLTESGLNYKAQLRAQRLAYLADKWTDILASAVAVCSLIVSIVALLRTL